MTEHKKIAIEYISDKPFIICADCPWYDKENKLLLPYDEDTGEADIRIVAEKKLAEHNEKIGDIYTKTLTEVKEKSVIKNLGSNVWRVEYSHNGQEFRDVFVGFKEEKIEEIWQDITKKIVGKY